MRSASVWVVATAGASAAMISSSSVAGTLRGGLIARRGDRHPDDERRDRVPAAARFHPHLQPRAAVRPDLAEDAVGEANAVRGQPSPGPDAEPAPAQLPVPAREL